VATTPNRVADVAETFFRASVNDLVPYEPGKPVEEVQRELGLDRVVKLASNEGPFGPFAAALEAIARCAPELNRYPDGGAYRLRAALAERHGVPFEEVAVGAGSDGLVDGLSQAALEPGDEIVCGWPSFPSYVIDAKKVGAVARTIPLSDHRYDLEAILAAVGPRTKIVYVCHPNNPTGTMNTRAELDEYFERVPEHVLTVLDQAYFEYIDDPDYPDGYGIAPASVVTALSKVRRAFDITTPAQEAALASLDDPHELERRRAANAADRPEVERILLEHGFRPALPAAANFLYAELGTDSRPFFEELLREGVIVRPTHGFGCPEGFRVTVGTAAENAFFAQALQRARPA
jgi:histidinol-phosphate aminotransferase